MTFVQRFYDFARRLQDHERRWQCLLIVILALGLYLLGFNYYVPPTNGDDVAYYHGAVSLADGEGYTSQGMLIRDWPPIQSLLTAGAMWVTGYHDYFITKLVNLVSVIAALLLSYDLMKRQERRYPFWACLLMMVAPTSFIIGTGAQADFTFFALSMIYFLLLARLSKSRSWFDAVACGLVLGAATLTRWQGVLLGVGLLFQANKLWWSMPRRIAWQETLAASIGAGLVLAWEYWLRFAEPISLTSASNYELHGPEIWRDFAPLELGAEILNTFTQFENIVLRISPESQWLVHLGAILCWSVLIHGFCRRVSARGLMATDLYVLATLALYSIYAYKEARYMIPLAPFLLDYAFTSLDATRLRWSVKKVGFACLLAAMLLIDGLLIFHGDGRHMGPRTQLLLADEKSFLRGYYIDLYETCRQLAQEHPDAVIACDKFHNFIVRHYSGLETHFPPFAPLDQEFDFYLEIKEAEVPAEMPAILWSELVVPSRLDGRLMNPSHRGQVILWEVKRRGIEASRDQ